MFKSNLFTSIIMKLYYKTFKILIILYLKSHFPARDINFRHFFLLFIDNFFNASERKVSTEAHYVPH